MDTRPWRQIMKGFRNFRAPPLFKRVRMVRNVRVMVLGINRREIKAAALCDI